MQWIEPWLRWLSGKKSSPSSRQRKWIKKISRKRARIGEGISAAAFIQAGAIPTETAYAIDRGALEPHLARIGYGPPAALKVRSIPWPTELLTGRSRSALALKFETAVPMFWGFAAREYSAAELGTFSEEERYALVAEWRPSPTCHEGAGAPICERVMPVACFSTAAKPGHRSLSTAKMAEIANKLAAEGLLAGQLKSGLYAVDLAPPLGEAVAAVLALYPDRRICCKSVEDGRLEDRVRQILGTELADFCVPEGQIGRRLFPAEPLTCPGCSAPTPAADLRGADLLIPGALVCPRCYATIETHSRA